MSKCKSQEKRTNCNVMARDLTGPPILFDDKLSLHKFHRFTIPLYVTSTQHHFSTLGHLNALTFLQIKHQQKLRWWLDSEMTSSGNSLLSGIYWPTLSYENLPGEESSNKKHGLLDALGLALWCKLQL